MLSLIPAVKNERALFEKGLFTYRFLYSNCAAWKKYIPSLHLYGLNNQYHQWLFGNGTEKQGVIHGDFGVSYRDGSPVMATIGKSVKWTLLLSLSALIMALFISILVGLKAGARPGGLFDRITGFLSFSLYALPGFFVASMLLLFFANPDFWDWFPASGIKDPEVFNPNESFFRRAIGYLPFLILPVISLTYAQFAFITRQVRAGVIEAMESDYVKAARSFGLTENQILLKHVLPNILFPLITLVGQSLPLLFGGSVIIESIFSIPGMGLEMYQSVIALDYPMIVAIFTIIGFLTMTGYLLSDILYAIADPRVRQGKEAKS
ncbi:MAG: ABC transporter permease [Bacteroidia bacterium]